MDDIVQHLDLGHKQACIDLEKATQCIIQALQVRQTDAHTRHIMPYHENIMQKCRNPRLLSEAFSGSNVISDLSLWRYAHEY